MNRRAFVIVAGAVVLMPIFVAVGRWEGHRQVRHDVAGMRAVLAAIGPLDRVGATGYRIGPPDCLAYPVPKNAVGLEVCFDRNGRVVETVDRRGAQPVYSSLNYDPSLSTLRGLPSRIAALIRAAVRAATGK